MNLKQWLLVAVVLVPAVAYAGMGMMKGPGMMRGGMMNMSMARHHYVMRNGLPKQYARSNNLLKPDAETIATGQQLFVSNCASCHGDTGRGDGPAGASLDPRPANIARFAKMPMASDAYLYWTIGEGGAPVGSAMPPFKDVLTHEEISKIILYLRRM